MDEFPKSVRPWDYNIFPPLALDDSAELTISIKWTEKGDWEYYKYKIALELIDTLPSEDTD